MFKGVFTIFSSIVAHFDGSVTPFTFDCPYHKIAEYLGWQSTNIFKLSIYNVQFTYIKEDSILTSYLSLMVAMMNSFIWLIEVILSEKTWISLECSTCFARRLINLCLRALFRCMTRFFFHPVFNFIY